jgi:hypothetical protein
LLNSNSQSGKNCKTTPTLYWPKYLLKVYFIVIYTLEDLHRFTFQMPIKNDIKK